jgi:hypothetical protein
MKDGIHIAAGIGHKIFGKGHFPLRELKVFVKSLGEDAVKFHVADVHGLVAPFMEMMR